MPKLKPWMIAAIAVVSAAVLILVIALFVGGGGGGGDGSGSSAVACAALVGKGLPYNVSDCVSVAAGAQCTVSCADGYTGTSESFSCPSDNTDAEAQPSGALPTCTPSRCEAGKGTQYVDYGGYIFRTLDGAEPDGGMSNKPNKGCQCPEKPIKPSGKAGGRDCSLDKAGLLLPKGFELAAADAATTAVLKAHGWSTLGLVLEDGGVYAGQNANATPGAQYKTDLLTTDDGKYTVQQCNRRILARCTKGSVGGY